MVVEWDLMVFKPLVNEHKYGTSPSLMGKLPINGHVQWLCDVSHHQRVNQVTAWCFDFFHILGIVRPTDSDFSGGGNHQPENV